MPQQLRMGIGDLIKTQTHHGILGHHPACSSACHHHSPARNNILLSKGPDRMLSATLIAGGA